MSLLEKNTIVLYRLPEEKELLLEDMRRWCRREGKLPFDVPVEYLRHVKPLDPSRTCAVYFSEYPYKGNFQGVRLVGLEKFVRNH